MANKNSNTKTQVLTNKEKDQLKAAALKELNGEIKDELVSSSVDAIKVQLDKTIKDLEETIDVEYKSELKDKITEELIDDIKERVKKDEAKLARRKTWKIIRQDILIVILIFLIAFLGFIIYRKIGFSFVKDFNLERVNTVNVVETTTTTKIEETKDLNWYIDKYGYILDTLKISNADLLKSTYNIDNISNQDKLIMSYLSLDSDLITKEGVIYQVKDSSLHEAYSKLFIDDNYAPENFSIDNINYVYSPSNESFIALVYDYQESYRVVNYITNINVKDNEVTFICNTGVILNDKLYNFNNLNYEVTKEGLSQVTYKFINNDGIYYLSQIN